MFIFSMYARNEREFALYHVSLAAHQTGALPGGSGGVACGETVQLTGVGTGRGGHVQGVLRGDGLHDLTAVKKKKTVFVMMSLK